MRTPLYALATALPLALVLIACGSSGARNDSNLPPAHLLPASRTSHMAVIVMENKERSEVMGSSEAPYLRSLAKRYASPSRFYAKWNR